MLSIMSDPANRDCLENKKTKPHVLHLIIMGKFTCDLLISFGATHLFNRVIGASVNK